VRSALLTVLVFLAACGQSPAADSSSPTTIETAPSTSSTSTPTTSTSSTITTRADLRYEWPEDASEAVGFWAPLRMTGAFEMYRFQTLEELADSATIVVVAAAVGTGPSATIGGDPDNNEATTTRSLIVEVLEVIRTRTELLGIPTPEPGERITVIVDHSPGTELSSDPVLLFLQAPDDDRLYYQIPPEEIAPEYREYYAQTLEAWEAFRAGKYMFLNSQSLLVGDAQSTVSPWMPGNVDLLSVSSVPIAEIAERIRSMPPPEM